MTILGARPQFIKASAISNVISKFDNVSELMVHTGQHFDANMSDVFFSELDMRKPAYQLDIHGGTHGAMTGRMLVEIEQVLMLEKPDAVLVYGDTNSTLAGALAAVKLHIPVAHVESGLRSFNMEMPEEINRILTDRISHWLFTPTETATEHLKKEGFSSNQIFPVGDVMYDVALHHGARVSADRGVLADLDLKPGQYILATIHRAENTDDSFRLSAIVSALIAMSKTVPIVWPIHPRTRAILKQLNLLESIAQHLHLIDPVGYLDMVRLEKYAALIATDSGGVQKEAFFYRVPCVTLRDETEWVELVDAGWNRLASPNDASSLIEILSNTLGVVGKSVTPYGDGDAAMKIVTHLLTDLVR